MEMNNRKFVVVEYAGYEGENEVRSFDTLREAFAFMDGNYTPEERAPACDPGSMKIDVRQDWTDEHGEEHSEYVY